MKLKCIISDSQVSYNEERIPYWEGHYVFEYKSKDKYGDYKHGQSLESIEITIHMVDKDDSVCNLYQEDKGYNIVVRADEESLVVEKIASASVHKNLIDYLQEFIELRGQDIRAQQLSVTLLHRLKSL